MAKLQLKPQRKRLTNEWAHIQVQWMNKWRAKLSEKHLWAATRKLLEKFSTSFSLLFFGLSLCLKRCMYMCGLAHHRKNESRPPTYENETDFKSKIPHSVHLNHICGRCRYSKNSIFRKVGHSRKSKFSIVFHYK